MHLFEFFRKDDLRRYFNGIKGRKIFPVQIFQTLLHIYISVDVDIAVRRMIIGSVEIQKFFIGELRNAGGISAGLDTIGGIREKRIEDLPLQDILRRRKCTFHLIVYNTIVDQLLFRTLQLVMPALLKEDLFPFVNIRIKDRIQINIHQILEILIVAAGNGIHGLIRIRHGIQKRVQGTFYQLYKRILGRIFAASAENAVLHDMGRSLAVYRSRTECDVEHFVLVIIQNHSHTGS